MKSKVIKYISKYKMMQKGDKVLVACSGGPDSLALLHLLYQLRDKLQITLEVAHVNHMLRGIESDREAQFVVDFCARLNIQCHVGKINVLEYKNETSKSLEDAARIMRYRFLFDIANTIGATKVALGHHQDDQAETVLLHLIRGAGSLGLKGMSPLSGLLVRPFLCVRHSEIVRYCKEQDLNPCIDSSNSNTEMLRNRIRHQLVPLLDTEFQANITNALCRTADIIREEQQYLEGEAQKLIPEMVKEVSGTQVLTLSVFYKMHLALQRQMIRLLIEKKQGTRKGITFDNIETLLDMANFWQVGTRFTLPGGLVVSKGYGFLRIGESEVSKLNSITSPGYMLNIPGNTLIKELQLHIKAEVQEKGNACGNLSIYLDLDKLELPLFVRTRLSGDRFSPSGLSGTKKLKDYFIDKKVPREKRDSVPIICDAKGIVWVGGYQLSERCKVTGKTKNILQLSIIY